VQTSEPWSENEAASSADTAKALAAAAVNFASGSPLYTRRGWVICNWAARGVQLKLGGALYMHEYTYMRTRSAG